MVLSFRQDGDLYFAHSPIGMYTIQQLRRRFILTLELKGASPDSTQELGSFPTLAKAKTEANKTERIIRKQLET